MPNLDLLCLPGSRVTAGHGERVRLFPLYQGRDFSYDRALLFGGSEYVMVAMPGDEVLVQTVDSIMAEITAPAALAGMMYQGNSYVPPAKWTLQDHLNAAPTYWPGLIIRRSLLVQLRADIAGRSLTSGALTAAFLAATQADLQFFQIPTVLRGDNKPSEDFHETCYEMAQVVRSCEVCAYRIAFGVSLEKAQQQLGRGRLGSSASGCCKG